ncbi:MAG TPA: hypothetical protein VI815_00825 [Candidatus Nanoarchaeia archaeon]|nr:hypothetical protein [Candidatus Nanoarchaeia archaeon]
MKGFNSKVIALMVSIFVISILIIAGPADAFTLGVSVKNKEVNLGQKADLFVSSQLGENEIIDVQKFELVIFDSEKSFSCEYLPNGTFISECDGFSIIDNSMVNETNIIGYGYGYGYQTFKGGKLGYNISIDTNVLGSGIYNVKIIMTLEDEVRESSGGELFVIDVNGLKGCSLRASNGIVEINDLDSGRNRLSLNVPLQNAAAGRGSLQAQVKKSRVMYDFRVVGTLENSPTSALIFVKGNYRENRTNLTSETAVIYLDKINKEISIAGNKIDAQNMIVTLMRRC